RHGLGPCSATRQTRASSAQRSRCCSCLGSWPLFVRPSWLAIRGCAVLHCLTTSLLLSRSLLRCSRGPPPYSSPHRGLGCWRLASDCVSWWRPSWLSVHGPRGHERRGRPSATVTSRLRCSPPSLSL